MPLTYSPSQWAPPKYIEIPGTLDLAIRSDQQILARERLGRSFDTRELSLFLYGSEQLRRRAELLEIITREPAFDKSALFYAGRLELYSIGLRKEKRFAELAQEHHWSQEDISCVEGLVDFSSAFRLHKVVYIGMLEAQASEEQKKLFLDPARRYEHIGCYAQTELGHGSNVQGLETTATYDAATHEFVLHSPSRTATKWWPGTMGRAADHAVVMAQLVLKGKRVGIHGFVVQIRDLKTRIPLEGRIVGDIGPKVGIQGVDNGFLNLQNVRIPHVNMLSRFSSVDFASGVYTKPANPQLAYGSMTTVRARLVRDAGSVLAKAATIAIRFCAVRQQFASSPEAPETQIIDYQTVQWRVFPVVVTAFAFHLTGRNMFREAEANNERIQQGDFSTTAEIHAATCALKSYTTIAAADGIEACRRACGGQGYSLGSGLGTLGGDYSGAITAEGDSYVIPQQTARYLFKQYRKIVGKSAETDASGALPHIVQYTQDPNRRLIDLTAEAVWSLDSYVQAFGYRAAHLVASTVQQLDVAGAKVDDCAVEMFRVSWAHAQYVVIKAFATEIEATRQNLSSATMAILSICFELYACSLMDQGAADFLLSGYTTVAQQHEIRRRSNILMRMLRADVVAVVDAFAIADYTLNSTIGRSDGDIYSAIVDFAERSPLNAVTWNTNLKEGDLIASGPKL